MESYLIFKKQRSEIIGLSKDQLQGKDVIFIDSKQHNAFDKAKTNKAGRRVTLTY